MDVIALSQAGFPQAVAPLGTALTEEQIAELWRLVPEPTLCFDGDAAGERAAARAAERALPLLKPGQSLRFALLPEGEDPDTLILARGLGGHAGLLDRGPAAGRDGLAGRCWPARRWIRRSAGRACARRSTSACPGSRTRAVQEAYRAEFDTRLEKLFNPGTAAAATKARWVPRDERRDGRRGRTGGGAGVRRRSWAGRRCARRRRTPSGCAAGTILATLIHHPELVERRLEALAHLTLPVAST